MSDMSGNTISFSAEDNLNNERIFKLEKALKVAVEALKFYSSGANFENGVINSSDIWPAEKITGRVISHYSEPPTITHVFVGGKTASEALAKIRELRGNE